MDILITCILAALILVGLSGLTRLTVNIDMRLKGRGLPMGSPARVLVGILMLMSGFAMLFTTMYFSGRIYALVFIE